MDYLASAQAVYLATPTPTRLAAGLVAFALAFIVRDVFWGWPVPKRPHDPRVYKIAPGAVRGFVQLRVAHGAAAEHVEPREYPWTPPGQRMLAHDLLLLHGGRWPMLALLSFQARFLEGLPHELAVVILLHADEVEAWRADDCPAQAAYS